ncbi:hypothetical protein OUZ56_008236 [Daphnia magna]|uniref:Uncharacterized protein n=1 Tax=Daphnia magna TaxID=35525 RepID=A0ABR0ACD7_9CRUS|nr:hypothetical protein OUZ56_008236 [Daphnia magna]
MGLAVEKTMAKCVAPEIEKRFGLGFGIFCMNGCGEKQRGRGEVQHYRRAATFLPGSLSGLKFRHPLHHSSGSIV